MFYIINAMFYISMLIQHYTLGLAFLINRSITAANSKEATRIIGALDILTTHQQPRD